MQLKLDVLPYDEVDFENILNILDKSGFIHRYEHEGKIYACIPTFTEHQRITGSEATAESKIPPPKPIGKKKEALRKHSGNTDETLRTTGREGKGREKERSKEGKGVQGIFPDQNFEINLSELEIGKAIQYVSITKHVDADEKLITSLWETFKIKNFTGQKFYKGERDIISHFFESLKFVQVNGANTDRSTPPGSTKKLGTSDARIDTARKW